MSSSQSGDHTGGRARGYMGPMLRVDLSKGETKEEVPDESLRRKYLGGTGIGIK